MLIYEPVKPRKNVRGAGEDVRSGDHVFAPGVVLGAAEIGLLASLGHPLVHVHRRPRVAIVATGSELVEVDHAPGPGQIRNSNSYALRAQCQQLGVEPDVLGIVSDDYQATKRLMAEGLEYDVLLTTGGVSVGEFDFVKDELVRCGAEEIFWRVAQRPGKPLPFAATEKTLVFSLAGNPV